jgi:hypothetical protein
LERINTKTQLDFDVYKNQHKRVWKLVFILRFLTQSTAVLERLVHQLSIEVNLHINICI